MTPSAFAMNRKRTLTRLLVGAGIALSLARASAQIVPGTNVNMVAGQRWPDGDPFLQRQNEPSIAVSSRNVLHLVAGANDYRTVDLPGLPADKPTATRGSGSSSRSTADAPGRARCFPAIRRTSSAVGIASPLKGFDAAADPLVERARTDCSFIPASRFSAPPSSGPLRCRPRWETSRVKEEENEPEETRESRGTENGGTRRKTNEAGERRPRSRRAPRQRARDQERADEFAASKRPPASHTTARAGNRAANNRWRGCAAERRKTTMNSRPAARPEPQAPSLSRPSPI